MALPAPAMSMSGFVPPHVPLDTNYRTNPGFVPPAHSGMVPMPITLSPPNNQSHPSNGMGSPQGIGSPSVVGPTLTQPPPLQRQPPAPPSTAASSTETRTSRSKSQRIAKQNGSAPPNRPASRASSQTPSTDSTAAPLKMAKVCMDWASLNNWSVDWASLALALRANKMTRGTGQMRVKGRRLSRV